MGDVIQPRLGSACGGPTRSSLGHQRQQRGERAPDPFPAGNRTLVKKWESNRTVLEGVQIPAACSFDRGKMSELPAMRSASSPAFGMKAPWNGIRLTVRREVA
jgi:hypothetical protein